MSLPRFRFTVRWMMVVVGVLALSIGTFQELTHLRAARFRAQAELHNREAAWLLSERQLGKITMADIIEESRWTTKMSENEKDRRQYQRPSQRMIRRAEWHRVLGQKYEHAARYPWLPVAPDPPEPE